MMKHLANQKGYWEVPLKQSGSLILWSGGQRYYSKNSCHNVFSQVAEILLRQHFVRAYWKDMNHNDERGKETKDDSTTTITTSTKQGLQEVNYYDCSRYL